MTNDHVVTLDGQLTSGQSIMVTFSDNTQAPATIVGEDATRDLAAIKVAKTGLNPVTFGKSSDVQLAEWATVIGSPLDFRNSVTLGIVSGLDRTLQISTTQTLTGLMQIDTPISPGNSGGGCFDTQGSLHRHAGAVSSPRQHRSREHRVRDPGRRGRKRGEDTDGQVIGPGRAPGSIPPV